MKHIYRMISNTGHLCDYCQDHIAECVSNPTFSEDQTADNVIACDAFSGEFDKEVMEKVKEYDEPKPCPFCGSKNIIFKTVETRSLDSSYDVVGCDDCESFQYQSKDMNKQADIQCWNKRPKEEKLERENAELLTIVKKFTTMFVDTDKYPDPESVVTGLRILFPQAMDLIKKIDI